MKESEKLKQEFGQKWYRYGGLREIFDSDLNDLCEAVAREQREADLNEIEDEFIPEYQAIVIAIRDNINMEPLVTQNQKP